MRGRVLSGIRPSGKLHIANYLGALRQWPILEKEYDSIFMIADYHALDSLGDKKSFYQTILDTTRWILAVGVNPDRSIIFRQSDMPQHTELAWIFGSITPLGELERMTQFKEKSHGEKSVNSALLMYPVLMAADVLLYKATKIPIGEDQLQHLELTRAIARKFNQQFGLTFPEPKPLLSKAPRIMSLKDPNKKMSKTGDDGIALADNPREIKRKVMAAVTATKAGQKTMPPGVANLFTLLENFAPDDAGRFKKRYRAGTLKYIELKEHLADKIIETLLPLQERFKQISNARVEEVLKEGSGRSRAIAQTTITEVKEKIGLI